MTEHKLKIVKRSKREFDIVFNKNGFGDRFLKVDTPLGGRGFIYSKDDKNNNS